MSGRHRLQALGALALLVLAPAAFAPAARAGDGCSMLGVPSSAVAGEPGRGPTCAPVADDEAAAEAASEAALEAAFAALDALAQATPPAPAPEPTPRVAPTPAPAPAPRVIRVSREKRESRAARTTTDTTVVVRRGAKLDLHNFGGAIAVATWAKDAVRIQAEHSRRDWIEIKRIDDVLAVHSMSRMGPAQNVEFRVTLPAWMPIELTGIYNDVTADGNEGGISVETVRGDIAVRRAAGAIALRSVEGLVDLSDSKGTITVSSVNDAVRLMNVTGTIQAEAVNGDIQLIDLSSRNVEATTVNGAVLFDGRMFDGGTYRFATHNGDIAMGMNDRSNATVTVSTYAGDFAAPFPIRLTKKDKGKRFAFVLGTGKADVELESFQGAIQLFTPGDKEVLRRFADTWRENERERTREFRWIMKGESVHGDDADSEAPQPPAPPAKKGK